MEQHQPVLQSARRYIDPSARSALERLLDAWFAPKQFESTALYERLGVLLVKRYAPTGGDFVNRRYGITIADIHPTLDSLIQFEQMTRKWEASHELAFLRFLAFTLRRAMSRQTTLFDLAIAIVAYLALILSPAMLQRYNRLRAYTAIRRLAARQVRVHYADGHRRSRPDRAEVVVESKEVVKGVTHEKVQ